MKLTIFFHLFYPDTWPEMKAALSVFKNYDAEIYINLCSEKNYSRIQLLEVQRDMPEAVVLNTGHQGRDIGAKLAMMSHYLDSGKKSDYLIFLHDKKSTVKYHVDGKYMDTHQWKKDLFSIVESENIPKIIDLFQKDEKLGMVGSKKHMYSQEEHGERVIFGNNKTDLEYFAQKFHLKNIQTENTDFLGGTMFWVRSQVFEKFFTLYPPLSIRAELEKGFFTDRFSSTKTHSFERLFSWIVVNEGYKILGF